MLGRVVITSVPRGLDGGAGFQTVLRTHGMQPSVAERLAGRAAYPHPFPFGDPRNPHVLFHRIERVGDRTIHILGSIRDAGGSFTGRSNHLAELIAIDSAETRGLPSGPGFAALEFPWLERWTGEPRAVPLAEEIAIPANDSSDPEATRLPARCTAWEKATGDAGWAGELAQSFLDGRRALIWAGDTVNVLELFTESLRLLPANVRWQVTFNTCEIEPFPAHWRAVRPELGLVGNYEPTNELRLVLGKIRESRSRAPDHDLGRQARGEAPARETRSTPTGDGGNFSATYEHDAALRARLREISETRRSRTGPAVAARTAARTPGMHRWVLWALLPAVLAILGTGVLVVRSSRMTTSDDNSLSDNLRSSIEERERVERVPEEEKQAKVRREKEAKAVVQASVDAERAEAERAKAKRAEEVEQTKVELAETTRVKAANEDKKKAQKLAIQKLESKKEMTVPLIDSEPTPDLSPYPTSKAIELCDDFDIDNLIFPSLELVSPYNEANRLRVDDRSDSLSGVPTWPISGTIFQKSEGTRTKAIEAGRIVAREGKLFLELTRDGPEHALFPKLKNSLLVISTRDFEDARSLTQRRKIRLAQPEKPSLYLLDPLPENDVDGVRPPQPPLTAGVASRVDVEKCTKDRMRDMEKNQPLSWIVELRHPAIDEPVILTQNESEKTKTLLLIKPPTVGLKLRYHTIDGAGHFQECCETMQCAVTVSFTLNGFECRPNILGLESSILKNTLTIDLLHKIRDRVDPQFLKSKVYKLLCVQPDRKLNDLLDEMNGLQRAYDNIPPPGSNPSTAPHTPEYRAKYERDRAEVSKQLKTATEAFRGRNVERVATFSKDAEDLVKAVVDAAGNLMPIEARIKEVTATAVLASGTEEYKIPIVVPSADPVQD